MAAFALPEFAATARRPSSRARSFVTTTGAASTPERVNRAALVASRHVADEQADVGVPGRLQAGRDAGGAEAVGQPARAPR